MSKPYSVYCLLCPQGKVRYIGITCASPSSRLRGHIADTKRRRNDHKTNWIRSLLNDGEEPTMRVVKSGLTNRRAEFLERLLIRLLQRPFLLVNSHEGGSTGLAGMSEEVRARHRESMKRVAKTKDYAILRKLGQAAIAKNKAKREAIKAERRRVLEKQTKPLSIKLVVAVLTPDGKVNRHVFRSKHSVLTKNKWSVPACRIVDGVRGLFANAPKIVAKCA